MILVNIKPFGFWRKEKKSALLQSLKCPWTNFSSSDKKAREAEGWGSESWPRAVLLVGGMLLSQHICISHWPYCLGVHLSQLKGCSHWAGSEFNPLQSSKQSNDRRTDTAIKPGMVGFQVVSYWFVHSFLFTFWNWFHKLKNALPKMLYLEWMPSLVWKKIYSSAIPLQASAEKPFCGGLQDCHSL